ncbi:low molecular mass early light-induced protein [Scenedesmus sp. NREL 46B-D3]|nr:low molecular mass early light-induced protein [Scenedesmus sp. NREL 46B-D3]
MQIFSGNGAAAVAAMNVAKISGMVGMAAAVTSMFKPQWSQERKLGPLEKGGTLSGAAAAGKVRAATGNYLQLRDGRFIDDRWVGGRWDLSRFANAAGETDWDAVIDAEMARRRLLEESPIPSTNEEPVLFDTSEIPWWAWVRRFHLPEAEKLNGRACMVGYFMALIVDQLTGYGLVDQQDSFLGKLLLHITVFGVLLVRSTADLDKYKNLLDEATFYDKQWQSTWAGVPRPSETEQ